SAPTADDVKAVVEFFNERGDLRRVVLQIAIHRDDDLTMSSVETSFERWGLAKVPSKTDDADALVRLMNFAQDVRGPVCAPVIDKADFIGLFERSHYLCEPDIERRCAPSSVIERHNARLLHSSFCFHSFCSL